MTLKHSKQRDAIRDFLLSRKDHPTADVVYMNVKESFPSISLGTVYRNLTLLAEIGDISRIRIGDGIDHFDATVTPHYHFICNECGSVIDLDMEENTGLNQVAAENFEGSIHGHVTYFYGRCSICSMKQATLS